MKRISLIIISVVMALLMAAIMPAQVFADATPEYISEVKIGMGKKPADAEKALAGYKILTDEKGNKVDLNQDAGGGLGSKGEKVVYLGYKTTASRGEAITDLALMNMKGGYSVKDYEALMDSHMKSQIIPFVDNFLAAIKEYRRNYRSLNESNKQRAEYIKSILDKFIDDDTGSGLGELLLKETKYEMGLKAYNKLSPAEKEKTDVIKESDKAYAKLSAEEKKKHADILTILAQSNGKATLMMENLITRAADTDENTWLDRLSELSYDALANSMENMLPTDAKAELAKLYDSDARKLINYWDDFRNELLKYDSYKKIAENYDEQKVNEAFDRFEQITENTPENELIEAANAYAEAQEKTLEMMKAAEIIGIYEALENYEYNDGTLLDYFMQSSEDISGDISVLYPFVASLSPGQRAGLDFVTIREYMIIALSEPQNYKDTGLDDLAETSVYDGIDRSIYEKGGVALTSESLRSDVNGGAVEEDTAFSKWTIAMTAITGAAFLAFATSAISWSVFSYKSAAANRMISAANNTRELEGLYKVTLIKDGKHTRVEKIVYFDEMYAARASVAKWFTLGFGVAMVILAGITTWLAYEDLVDYYKVDFTPIPHYMVDEKDITAFNESGEKIVLKNQSAYYKAVECNRTEKDEMFGNLGTCADMNGDVGRQWLALYAQKSDTYAPILASSLLVKVYAYDANAEVPAGYTTGIHMFGSGSAFNLNSELYNWNRKAPKVMIYFKTDTGAAKTGGAAGSVFSTGALALTGVAGLAAGALISGLAVNAGKKKSKKAEA